MRYALCALLFIERADFFRDDTKTRYVMKSNIFMKPEA
jgi:hypothetical protein